MERRDEWERRVRRWQRSGLTSTKFATREGVNVKTLRWWSWNLRREAQPAPSAIEFIEVTPALEPTLAVEVVLANGRVVRVPTSFDDATLCRVLAAAERA